MDCDIIFNSVNVRLAQGTGPQIGKKAEKTDRSIGVTLPRPSVPMLYRGPLGPDDPDAGNGSRSVGAYRVYGDAAPYPKASVSVRAAVGSSVARLSGAPAEFERGYRAVLVADVVGYTRLMEAAEIDTHKHYRALRLGIIDPAIITHRGHVVKNTGDGYVAVFEAPLDALRCAVELQQEVSEHQAQYPAEGRIEFRIGIHWDPVIFDLNDVFGRGVNIAVRLQTIAPAGGIAISSALLNQVGELQEFKMDDLGEIHLKNLTCPVHAYSVVPPGVHRGPGAGAGGPSGSPELPSIAVLPFSNPSNDPNEICFAEGFVDDIIVALSSIPELPIVSRGATSSLRQRPSDAGKVGERVSVRYVVSGRVRRSGNQVRLSVELADITSDAVMWAENYDLLAPEVSAVQHGIALDIAAKVAGHVRQAEVTRALREPPQSLNADDYLLRALDLLSRFDSDSFVPGRELLEKACEEDRPMQVPAHSRRSATSSRSAMAGGRFSISMRQK